MKLTDIDENLYLPILKELGVDITWEDIENNERIYRIIEEMVNMAGYEALKRKFFTTVWDVYIDEFNNNIIKLLNDKNNEFYGYITIEDAYAEASWVIVKYMYKDEDAIRFFRKELGFDDSVIVFGDIQKDFEDIIGGLIEEKLHGLDYYIGDKIFDMFGYGKFNFDINNRSDYLYFKKEIGLFEAGDYYYGYFDRLKREIAKMKKEIGE
jgi:hypothetical protein